MARLLMFKNIDDLSAENIERHTTEYQILSDAHIIGQITYGPYVMRPWEFSEMKKPGEERWLLLRTTVKAFSAEDEPWKKASREGEYHGGGVASELIALASVFLRRRLRLGPMVRLDDSPIYIPELPGQIDQQLTLGESNFARLEGWFESVRKLDPDLHFPLILAAKFYHQAVELIEGKPDLAYLLLVSAIEVLSNEYEVEPPSLSEIDQGLANSVARIEDPELRQEIEGRIVRRRLIARRFVAFIGDHVDVSFWQVEGRPIHGRVEPEQLPNLMKRVYDQRSRTLHDGEPFPPYIFHPAPMNGEMPVGLSLIVGEKTWEIEDFIPTPSFFERLVNHVLKNFVTRNQVS